MLKATICLYATIGFAACAAAAAPWERVETEGFASGDTTMLFGEGGLPIAVMHRGRSLLFNCSLNLSATDGTQLRNVVPPRTAAEAQGDTIRYRGAIKREAHTGAWSVQVSAKDERIRLEAQLDSETLKIADLVLRLPIEEYAGETLRAGDRRALLPREPAATLIPLGRFAEIQAAETPGLDWRVFPDDGVESEVRDARQWDIPGYAILLKSPDGKRIGFEIEAPRGGEWQGAAADSTANLLDNGGFEAGLDGWGARFQPWDRRSSHALDSDGAAEGRQALRLDLRPNLDSIGPSAPSGFASSEWVSAPPMSPVRFSVSLRASREATPVTLRIYYFTRGREPNGGQREVKKTVIAGTEWSRVSFDPRLPIAQENAYSASVAVQAPEGQPLSLWIDGARLRLAAAGEEPTADEYAPHAAWELGGDAAPEDNIFALGQPAELCATLVSHAAEDATVRLRRIVLGPGYRRVFADETEAAVSAGETVSFRWTAAAPHRGPYRVYLDAFVGGRIVASRRFSFGVLEENPSRPEDGPGMFGAHIGPTSMAQTLRHMQRIGFTWQRGGNAVRMAWADFEPEEGQWSANAEAQAKEQIEFLRQFNIHPIVIPTGIPRWASSAAADNPRPGASPPAAGKMDAYGAFVRRYAAGAAAGLDSFEIWNEPNIALFFEGTPQQYAETLKTAYRAIKDVRPDAMVAAFSFAGFEESAKRFLDAAMKAGAQGQYDAISWHPYRPGRLGPEETDLRGELEDINTVIGQYGPVPPLRVTEVGWFAPHKFFQPFTPYKNRWIAKRLIGEEECARYYTQTAASCFAYGVTRFLYFIFDEGDIASRWFHGFIGPNGRFPKAHYFSAAAAVRHMDRSECLGQEEIAEGVWLTRFIRGGRETGVLWKASGAAEYAFEADGAIEFADLYGNAFRLAAAPGAPALLTIGEDPVYVLRPRAEWTLRLAERQLAVREIALDPGRPATVRLDGEWSEPARLEVRTGLASRALSVAEWNGGQDVSIAPDGFAVPGEAYDIELWIGGGETPRGLLRARAAL